MHARCFHSKYQHVSQIISAQDLWQKYKYTLRKAHAHIADLDVPVAVVYDRQTYPRSGLF